MELTQSQKKAVALIDRSAAIIAGAGSGKTEVLTQRLIHILKSGGANLHQILCVTFTEKAAQELKRRIARHLPEEERKNLPWADIGTFHRFCLNFLREQAPLLGFSGNISVWEEHTARLSIHKHCRKTLLRALDDREPEAVFLLEAFEFREVLLLLEELMQFRWHFEKIMHQEHLRAATRLYRKILAAYAAEKRERQVMDFQDLEAETLSLLRSNSSVLKQYQGRFRHILVDEAQDINDLQRDLISLLFHPGENRLCVVGDPKQSIYRFRGANVGGLKELSEQILQSGGERIELRENFRSRPAVLDWINGLFENLFPADIFIPLVATREEAPESCIRWLPVEGEKKDSSESRRKGEAEAIARYIRHRVDAGKNRCADITLLFQSLTGIRHYEKALQASGIPYRLSRGRGFLNAQEVIDLLFCLKLMVTPPSARGQNPTTRPDRKAGMLPEDRWGGNARFAGGAGGGVKPEDRMSLVGLMRSPLLGFSDVEITGLCGKHPTDLGKALLRRPEAAWLRELTDQKETLGAADILETVLQKTHYDILCHELDPSGTKRANIEQCIELARELEQQEDLSLEDLADYFGELKRRNASLSPSSGVDLSVDACQLMTVHAAKGLQFPVVILPDLIRTPPPHNHPFLFVRNKGLALSQKEGANGDFENLKKEEKEADLEERKRLLYVALTRAEEAVIIPWHEGAGRAGPWYTWIKEHKAS